LKTVKAFKPVIKQEEYVKLILYPYTLFVAKLEFKRLFLKPKVLLCAGLLDMCRSSVLFINSIPEITDIEVDEESIIPPTVPDSDVRDIIEYEVMRYGIARINTWWAPEIEFLEMMRVHKIFYVTEEGGRRYIVDTLTGDKKRLEMKFKA